MVKIRHATALQPKVGEKDGGSLTNSHVTPPIPHLFACYQEVTKQNVLQLMVDQLIQKQCIREMSHSECGFFSRVLL